MKSNANVLWMVVVMSLVAAPSPGDIVAYHDAGVPVDGLPGFKGYTVFFTSSDPSNPQAGFQGSFDGPMNQLQAFGAMDTPTLTLAEHLGADIAKDSHFLLYDDEILWILTEEGKPHETAAHLGGTFSIWPSNRSEPKPFAYLVIPDGQQVTMSAKVGDSAAILNLVDLVIPQPPSLTFEAGSETVPTLEAGSADREPDPAASTETIASETLQTDSEDIDRIQLVDVHDNQDDGSQEPEAIYVDEIVRVGDDLRIGLRAKSPDLGLIGSPERFLKLLNGSSERFQKLFNLTDLGGTIDYNGGSIIQVPEPAALSLLTLGALALCRRRRG